jgi:predicted secreted hydrolase
VSYPVEWRLDGPSLDIRVTPLADDQAQQFAEPIWSGAVVAEGLLNGEPVSGAGTLNLTGYAER